MAWCWHLHVKAQLIVLLEYNALITLGTKTFPDMLSFLHYIHNGGHSSQWQNTQTHLLDLSLLPLCCCKALNTLFTPAIFLKLSSSISQEPRGVRLWLCLPFLPGKKGWTMICLGETPFPTRPPLRTEQLLYTDGKTAFPPVTLLDSDISCFSSCFPGDGFLSEYHQMVLREDGCLIVQRALQTQPEFSAERELLWLKSRAAVIYISQALGHQYQHSSSLLSKLRSLREKKNIIILNMHQNYLLFQRILLSPLGSSWVFKLPWKQAEEAWALLLALRKVPLSLSID